MNESPNQRPALRYATECLRNEIAVSEGYRLPPLRRLAAKYGVSLPTISRAAGLLRSEGLLVYFRGRAMEIAGQRPGPDASPVRVPSWKRTSMQLEQAFLEHDLRTGQILPKVSAITEEYRVTRKTAIKALDHLEQRGIIHRLGKRRFFGPPPCPAPSPGSATSSDSPVIILLVERPSNWRSVSSSVLTHSFSFSFQEEVRRYNTRIVPLYTHQGVGLTAGYYGFEGARRLMEHCGAQYLGALACITEKHIAKFDGWFSFLERFRRPVVCFDPEDIGIPGRPVSENIVRLHYCENSIAEAALQHIARRGHRAAACPVLDKNPSGWQMRRLRILQKRSSYFGITITPVFSSVSSGNLPEISRSVLPELITVLKSTTCILALNDLHAIHYARLLQENGITIPDRISLLTFDNSSWSFTLGISSVDFGYSYLGYAAFHLLYGILPVHCRSPRPDIPCRSFVVDRGSVGICRDRTHGR